MKSECAYSLHATKISLLAKWINKQWSKTVTVSYFRAECGWYYTVERGREEKPITTNYLQRATLDEQQF